MLGGLGSLGGIEIGASRSFDRRGKLHDRSWPPGSSPRLPKSLFEYSGNLSKCGRAPAALNGAPDTTSKGIT